MASTDARPVPRKNVAYRVTFPILDADGDPVTGATGLDSEISKDGAQFADCTNEATEITAAAGSTSGVYYLDLTSTEMNADTVAIGIHTTSSGAKTTIIVMYPEEIGDYRCDVQQWLGTAAATPTVAGVPEVDVTHWIGTAAATPTVAGVPEVDITHIAGAAVSTSSAQLGVNVVNAGAVAWASGSITAAVIANGAINAAALAADAGTEIANAVWALDATGQQTQGSFGQVLGDSGATAKSVWGVVNALPDNGALTTLQADTDNIQTRLPAALVSGRIDASVGAMATDVLTAAALAADAKDEIVDQVWDELIAGHLGAGSTGAALNAAGGAGDPWAIAIPGAYGGGTAGNIVGNNLNATITSRASQASVNALPTETTIWDHVLEGALTARNVMHICLAALSGKLSGASGVSPYTIRIRDRADTKDRIVATTDIDGNRSNVTVDGS